MNRWVSETPSEGTQPLRPATSLQTDRDGLRSPRARHPRACRASLRDVEKPRASTKTTHGSGAVTIAQRSTTSNKCIASSNKVARGEVEILGKALIHFCERTSCRVKQATGSSSSSSSSSIFHKMDGRTFLRLPKAVFWGGW